MGGVIDETGKVYGYLTVIERAENSKEGRARWKCKCKCGNEVIVLGKALRNGNTKSCGCYQKEQATKSNEARGGDLTGKRFGKLVVIPYRFDFGLLDDNNELLGLIEYQGDIHFTYNNNGWNNKQSFDERVKHDKIKKEYCDNHNIKLFYITYKDDIEEKLGEILNELYCK